MMDNGADQTELDFSYGETSWRSSFRKLTDCLRETCCCCCFPSGLYSEDGFATPRGTSTQHLLGGRTTASSSQNQQLEVAASPSTWESPPLSDKPTLMQEQLLHPVPKLRSPSVTSLKGSKHGKSDSKLSLLDDDDMCPTCLEGYSEDNPKIVLKCGHHFHLQCIYAWLERSETCPFCGRKTVFDEIL